MNLTFRGVTLQGLALHALSGDEAVQHQAHEVFGLAGATLIVGADAGAEVDVIFELNGFATGDALTNYVAGVVKPLRGQPGTLTLAGAFTRTWLNMSLLAIQRIEHDGQHGPLPNNPHAPSAPWTDHLRLRFRRLGL